MITYKITLRKLKSVDEYPIVLRAYLNSKSKQISTGYKSKLIDWDETKQQVKSTHPDHRLINAILIKLKEKINRILIDSSVNDINLTLNRFEKLLRTKSFDKIRFFEFWEQRITDFEHSGKVNNAQHYRTTKNSFFKYCGKKEIEFSDVDFKLLEGYVSNLKMNNLSPGGIYSKLKDIRALFNYAIDCRVIDSKIYPFKQFRISRFNRNKLNIPLSDFELQKLIEYRPLSNAKELEAKYIFLMSFYSSGMNPIDLFKLKWKDNIKGNKIMYRRSKVDTYFIIEISSKLKVILDYFKESYPNSEYVLPYFNSNLTSKQVINRSHDTKRKINRVLKEIANEIGIYSDLRLAIARHTFAIKFYNSCKDILKVQKALGHKDISTTRNYLGSISQSDLDEAISKIFEPDLEYSKAS